jgi:putative redox protein
MSSVRPAIVTTATGRFRQVVQIGPHRLVADEPTDAGGDDAGPSPRELLLASLGTCTSMTVREYAARKGWPLASVDVAVHGEADRPGEFRITLHIRLGGSLTPDQVARLHEIANRCPVHKVLSGRIQIDSDIALA